MLTAPKSPKRGEQSRITEPLRVPSELAQGDRQIVQAAPSPPVSTATALGGHSLNCGGMTTGMGLAAHPKSAEAAQPAPELRGKGRIPRNPATRSRAIRSPGCSERHPALAASLPDPRHGPVRPCTRARSDHGPARRRWLESRGRRAGSDTPAACPG